MGKQIKKILIANRGEIACRVMKTARKMGIATVAVYSDADRKALHVRMADETVHIGASPAVESYLVIEKIISAAKETGADAIHPGYGFLSENPGFVRACAKAGIIFIGPSAEAMEAMGLKDAAKALMDKAGVPTTPGYLGAKQDAKTLKSEAGKIGYPVLIKAVAGGGGKGMRKVERASDFDAMLASCQREAKSSFGNDIVLLEKYIQSPRHIEVQVFGDSHGNVVHMFERDCSLQRRHQKVIEEAPAPGMTDAVRKAMTDAAIKAAKAVNYVGAGTVEFIVDGSGALKTDGFWFMEMNTRLQVEHPVTEMVTGLDLVELQIHVAQGEALMGQDEITLTGHAIEARLYAEDPSNDFLPSVGKISRLAIKSYSEGISERVDAGVSEGDEVSIFYDPMIAKYILHAENRDRAISEIREHIEYAVIEGVVTNADFLFRLLGIADFKMGAPNTHLIPANIHNLITDPNDIPLLGYAHAAVSLLLKNERFAKRLVREGKRNASPFDDLDSFRVNRLNQTELVFLRQGETLCVQVSPLQNRWECTIEDNTFTIYDNDTENDENDSLQTLQHIDAWRSSVGESHVELKRLGRRLSVPLYISSSGLSTSNANALIAPMPGKIIAVNVAAGDTVTAGDSLIVMEAMKMEMTLDAPRDGVVASVGGVAGDLVGDGHVLLTLEDLENER